MVRDPLITDRAEIERSAALPAGMKDFERHEDKYDGYDDPEALHDGMLADRVVQCNVNPRSYRENRQS
jgi:hypothetical protein